VSAAAAGTSPSFRAVDSIRCAEPALETCDARAWFSARKLQLLLVELADVHVRAQHRDVQRDNPVSSTAKAEIQTMPPVSLRPEARVRGAARRAGCATGRCLRLAGSGVVTGAVAPNQSTAATTRSLRT